MSEIIGNKLKKILKRKGTSSNEKSFDQKWPELLSFIGFQYINYLANSPKNRAV